MGTLYIVATPIGNLSDMSLRAAEVLKTADYILCEDTRHVLPLLSRYEITGRPLISLHKFNESEKCGALLDKLEQENAVMALVSDAGTPCISDPGTLIVAEANRRGIRVIGIPGASALTLSVSVSGLGAKNFAFLGFFPKDNKGKKEFTALMKSSGLSAFVVYESPLRIVSTLEYLKEQFPDAVASVSNDLTKKFERTYNGRLSDVCAELKNNPKAQKGEYAVVIEPNFRETAAENELCLEALIVNESVKNGITFKEAVKNLADRNIAKKNELYEASLELKNLFG